MERALVYQLHCILLATCTLGDCTVPTGLRITMIEFCSHGLFTDCASPFNNETILNSIFDLVLKNDNMKNDGTCLIHRPSTVIELYLSAH